MTKFFVGLYNYFERHKVLFYLSLSVCILFMALFAAQVRFEENVTSFFPDTKDSQNTINVFDKLKIKDKIMIMLSGKDGVADADSLIEAAEAIKQDLQQQAEGSLIKEIFSKADENLINSAGDFVYDNLPLFLSDEDYQRLDTLLTAGNIASLMQKNYSNLISPAGFALKNYLMRDPLGLGSQTLKHLQDFQLETNYELINEHIFSRDGSTLLMFITPVFNTGSTGKNDKLIRLIEDELQKAEKEHPQLVAEYFGGPSVGVYNARQIKKDTLVTSSIALIIIIAFISLVFKHKKSIPLIITPVLFGALFALCLIYFIKGGISAIAVGAGSAVMGIALSYSIHMLAHQNHVSSVQQLIREIAYPLTVGSFTTIGAFFGLIFTSSNLLRDFGLFASLALIGTTLFCLVYLPHFLKGQAHVKQGAVLRFIEKLNAYPYEKNKGLVGGILVLTLICLFTSQNVRFNEDMMSLNYEPAHLKQSENKLAELFDKKEKTVLFVSTGKNMGDATGQYAETNRLLSQLKEEGKIKDYASAGQFLIPEEVQEARLKQWHNYWTPEKKAWLRETIRTEAARYHFREHAFEPFFQWLDRPFQPLDYQNEITTRLLNEWQTSADSLTMLITQVRMNEADKEAVYPLFQPKEKVVIFDRGYFANQWVSAVNQDFYLILYISSFLIFFALWISYGRIELTLMSFLPMLVSWIIIVGLMGILGIEFNIINIILSTFIFGIGDDFSIFIMDGLQNKYRTGRQLLNSHKTAIFFSAFTTVIGMGTLVFARHPALQSISLISILGMIAVVLVAYTLQPILFRFFITAPASKGLPPYTLTGLARTGGLFLLFFIGCLFLRLLIAVMTLLPIRKAYKKQVLCQLIHVTCKGLIHIATFVHKEKINRTGETFKKPAILIANHQSFIDILVLLALTPKLVMVTNHWVWHSPFFGAIIRYADFYYVGDGYELYVERMRQKVKEGYSIAIFPEGTRTYDGRMKRFHKGAFYLSEKLQLDIIPVILYGNCKIIAKAQPFNVRKGIMLTEILPRIPANDATYGTTYQERTKSISARMKKEYARICREQSTTDNPVFYENLIQNYIYKGPVEEWYIRIKVKMEDNYRLFNRLVPVKGQITDIGCGFGPLCYMLSQLSEEREITGIDYDEDKIAVAQQGWLRTPHLQFVCADALEYPLPESDVFILNDMLHYMSYEHQRTLLLRCMERLRPEGKLIVRDGNAANTGKHRLTRFTELLSTGIFNFNKTTEQLCFTSEEQIRSIAQACGMQLEILPNDRYTSNTIYIFQKTNRSMSKYDIIIIGSGLGGLECGAVLSKEGYHVCVLEKNELFGGCFQTYQRGGHRMDTGIHYIGSLDEGQIMNQYFRYFGIMDKLSIQRMDEEGFDRIYYKNAIYDYAMGHERFMETLCHSFPHERENLKRYVAAIRSVGDLISIDHLKKGRLSQEGMDFFATSAAGMIASVTTNRDLQNVLAATSLLYGGIKNKSTFYEHAMINNSYLESAYRFTEGSMQVSLELIQNIRANGGTVLNRKEVTRILVKDEAIQGVEVNHEEVMESTCVISNLHPQLTLSLLDKNHSIKPAFVSRIKSLENSYGIFTLNLMMKKDCFPYQNHNIYLHGNEEVWYDKETHKGNTPSCMISMQVPRGNSKFTEVVSILTPMYMDEVSKWTDTTPEHRGEAYRQFKEEKTEQILQFLSRFGFHWSHCIEKIHTTTPLSYRDYTGTIDGSAYGIVKNYQYPQISFVSTRTKLKNLFLTGQNLNVHGALGVTLTAMLTCSEFVGQEYLAKKVGNA